MRFFTTLARAFRRFRPAFTGRVRALVFLIVAVGSLGIGGWLLWEASLSGLGNAPPLLPFAFFALATLALLLYNENRTLHLPRPVVASLAASALTAYVLLRLPEMSHDADFTGVTMAWVLAIAFYGAGVAPLPPLPLSLSRAFLLRKWHDWWHKHGPTALLLAAITLLALVLRVWQLGSIPFTLSGDEASFGRETYNTIRGEIRNPFSTGWLSQPTMSFFYNSLAIRLLGPSQEALRLPWALIGAATVPVAFWLVTRLSGPLIGFVTALLLATYHFHIHYSRISLNNIADPLFAGLALLFLHRAIERKSLLDWALAGAVCGGALYIYQGGRLTPLLVAFAIGYLFWRDRSFLQEHRLGLIIALGAFLVVAAPMIQYAFRFPDDFNARPNQIGIIQSGWLEREAIARNESYVTILFDQFRKAALAFNFYHDRTTHYGLPQPLLGPLSGALFLCGLGYATVRAFGSRAGKSLFPMIAWWWGGMLLGGMLTIDPPASQRIVTLALPVCFFIALAMGKLLRLAQRAAAGFSGFFLARAIMVVGAATIGFASLHTYFVDYTPKRIYGGQHAELATELAPVLRRLGPGYRINFAGAPAMFWDYPTLPFLVPNADAFDLLEPLTAPPRRDDMVPPGRGGAFIFLPWRVGELEYVRQSFPAGELQEFRNPGSGQVIGTLYVVPP